MAARSGSSFENLIVTEGKEEYAVDGEDYYYEEEDANATGNIGSATVGAHTFSGGLASFGNDEGDANDVTYSLLTTKSGLAAIRMFIDAVLVKTGEST